MKYSRGHLAIQKRHMKLSTQRIIYVSICLLVCITHILQSVTRLYTKHIRKMGRKTLDDKRKITRTIKINSHIETHKNTIGLLS